jgi:hypothetical protein
MDKKTTKQQTPALQIVWQWVSYGLWQWALVSLGVLLSMTLLYFIVDAETHNAPIYVLAAMLALLPLAFFVDRMYSRQEPAQKQGFAGVVMVLNAVLVFLATVGGFITAVVSGLSAIINGSSDALTITLISATVTTLLGGLLFIRIINPEQVRKYTKFFRWIMLAVAGVTLIAAIAGPIRSLQATRDDRLIEDSLYSISAGVQNYVYDQKKLPASLEDLQIEYDDSATQVIDRGLVDYRPNTKPASEQTADDLNKFTNELSGQNQPSQTYYYQLCATFDRKKGDPSPVLDENDLYNVGANHPKGKACFDLEARIY